MKKNILFLLLLIPLISSASPVKINGIWYELVSGPQIAMVNYTLDRDYQDDIVIPPTVNYDSEEYEVAIIGEKAFYDCSNVTSITLPNTIIEIKANAFSGCI